MADGLIDSLVHKACQTDRTEDTDPRTCLEHVAKLCDRQNTDRTWYDMTVGTSVIGLGP